MQCSYQAGSPARGDAGASTAQGGDDDTVDDDLIEVPWDEVPEVLEGTYSEEISLEHLPPEVVLAFSNVPDSPSGQESCEPRKFAVFKEPGRLAFEGKAKEVIFKGEVLTPVGGDIWSRAAFESRVGAVADMQHLWSFDLEPDLAALEGYTGPTDLVLVLEDHGSIVRNLVDPYWHDGGEEEDYNVAVGPAVWEGGKPKWYLHATRKIWPGKKTCSCSPSLVKWIQKRD